MSKKDLFKEAAKKLAIKFGFKPITDDCFIEEDGGIAVVIPQGKVFSKPFFFNGDNLVSVKIRQSAKTYMTVDFDAFVKGGATA